jgi:hypothetical protein
MLLTGYLIGLSSVREDEEKTQRMPAQFPFWNWIGGFLTTRLQGSSASANPKSYRYLSKSYWTRTPLRPQVRHTESEPRLAPGVTFPEATA